MDDPSDVAGRGQGRAHGERPFAETSYPSSGARPVTSVEAARGPLYRTREERHKRMFYTAQGLVLAFGVFLILMGGIGSLSREKLEDLDETGKFISPTIAHHYATSAHNLLLGLLFIVCSIGLYVPVFWARMLTFLSCILYVADTGALTIWEYVARTDAVIFEAFADIVFWAVVPVIIVVLLLVSAAGGERPAPATQGAD